MLDIAVNPPAFLHCGNDGGKIIICQRHIRRALCHVRTCYAHGAADIRRLQRGRIVYAVSRHGNDFALCLPGLDDADLILRRNSGVYGYMAYLPVQLFFTHLRQLCAGNGFIAFLHNSQILCNGGSRHHMVAGNHNRLNARLPADSHRITHLRAGRIDHAHKPHKGKIAFQFFNGRIFRHAVDFLIAHCQDAEGVGAHGVNQLLRLFHIACGADGQHGIKGALGDDHIFPIDSADNGHQLTIGIKGQLRQSGIFPGQGFLRAAVSHGGIYNGGFRGIPDMLYFSVLDNH